MENQGTGTLRWAYGTFFTAPEAIFNFKKEFLPCYAKMVYLCLCKHANAQLGAFPSYNLLKEECSIGSDATIKKALDKLCEYSLLRVEKRRKSKGRNKGEFAVNSYILYPPDLTLVTSLREVKNNEPTSLREDGPTSLREDGPTSRSEVELNELKDFNQNHYNNQTQLNSTEVKLSEVESSTSNTANADYEIKKPKDAIKKEKIKPRAEITAEVKEQIQYEWLANRFSDDISKPILNEILNTLVNGLRSERQYWTLRGENIPTEELQKRFRERDVTDIQSLVEDILRKTTPIGNPGAYITATLYRYGDGDHTKYTTMYNADLANRRQ